MAESPVQEVKPPKRRETRPFKWPTVFAALRDALKKLDGGDRAGAIETMEGAADWAEKWFSPRGRPETSMGITISVAIRAYLVSPMVDGATPRQVRDTVLVLEKITAREAKVAVVRRAQVALRLRYTGKTPEEAREKAVAAALRQIRSKLEESSK